MSLRATEIKRGARQSQDFTNYVIASSQAPRNDKNSLIIHSLLVEDFSGTA